MFSHLSVWLNVPEKERKILYEDIIVVLDKKEKEDAKNLRKRNIKVLKDILESMSKVTFKTRWSEAQKLLFKDPYFTQDVDLQNMDKEDALIVFEDHIRALEKEHIEDIEKKKKWMRRQERKNRDSFLCLLDELHAQGKLTPMSLWVELFSAISADERFNDMLYQPGSNPLDLFKFYVDDLKARYHDDKKLIKEILKEKKFEMDTNISLDEFNEYLKQDKRASSVDSNNIKLVFSGLFEKAEAKEKEKQKEEHKKIKKLEQSFKNLLKKLEISESAQYEAVKEKFLNEESYLSLKTDQDRERCFNEYISSLQETCLHHIKKKKEKKRKNKRSKSRSRSPSASDHSMDDDDESPSKKHADGESSSKKHKKSKKRKRQKSVNINNYAVE